VVVVNFAGERRSTLVRGWLRRAEKNFFLFFFSFSLTPLGLSEPSFVLSGGVGKKRVKKGKG
jgi:hypothetical protein